MTKPATFWNKIATKYAQDPVLDEAAYNFTCERSISYPMVKEAIALAKAKGQNELSPAALEGFASAKVLVEALC